MLGRVTFIDSVGVQHELYINGGAVEVDRKPVADYAVRMKICGLAQSMADEAESTYAAKKGTK